MKRIETLATLEGRKLLREIFKTLKYDKQLSSFSVLLTCWRVCTSERDLERYIKSEVSLVRTLGLFTGTKIWLEEVVNRFFFSTINSFVYFGAAILLVLIGFRRFSDNVNETMVIGGIIFEALMLLLMFFVMAFTPSDEQSSDNEKENESIEVLVTEIGEIGRDFAAVVLQLENLGTTFENLLNKQIELISEVKEVARFTAQAVAPNPDMLVVMKETNIALSGLKDTVNSLNIAAESLKKDEIEYSVRKEVEKLINNRIDRA
ncbi:MAG: hypothetical protein NT007_13265 [Candidatus Kapabacteria bacterium]|nr:hypothetical protein [Candidatus Kapabacteria bacterium]